MCGCHRSRGVAALLASPQYRKAIKIYPARDRRARQMVLEEPARTSASRPRWGWANDGSRPPGDPKYGESIVASWMLAEA